MTSTEEQLRRAGLELLGRCDQLAERGPALLHNAALLEGFPPEELDTLGAAMLRLRARPGQVLIAEGEVGDWMLLILSGTVDVTKKSGPDELSRLSVNRQGTALGERFMFDGAPRYASCTAIDAVEAAVLDRQAVSQLIREHPTVGAKLLVKLTQLLAQRLRNTSNQVVRLL
ncbi:MAG: cyclic nucleotide-binding domain-containing protein [Burkholderiaceae bacterium]